MRILICNERFLFRFGLDRVLIMVGKGMAERGHDVYLMGCRYDEHIVKQFSKNFISVPSPTVDYANYNEFTLQWLQQQWGNFFNKTEQPDVIIVGGWPFFQAIEFFSQVCPNTIFIDAGAVPLDGFDGHALFIQQKLRSLRQQYLSIATGILPISNFIAKSQSIPDRGSSDGVKTILLGANHMELSLWQSQMVGQGKNHGKSLSKVKKLQNAGKTCILNLGRWEAGCYKNSEACFDIMLKLVQKHPEVVLLVLSDEQGIDIPKNLQEYVKPIGFPDDGELQEIMRSVKLGISVSLWEGFNLPLAEMQWLQKPALALNLAAHPEVVVNPWFLCSDMTEMIDKADIILSDRVPYEAIETSVYNNFRSKFGWDNVVQNYCDYMENAVKTNLNHNLAEYPLLIIDVTNSSRDPANSGVIRVTRQLCRALQKNYDPIFVVWDFTSQVYILPSEAGYQQLSQFNGPEIPKYGQHILNNFGTISLDEFLKVEASTKERSVLFFFAETVLDPRCLKAIDYAKQRQWKTAAIFYDLIPLMYPHLCSDSVTELFSNYLKMLSGVDTTIPISEFSAQCLIDYWSKNSIVHGDVNTALLPGEFGQQSRSAKMQDLSSNSIHILCVSTLEPRKNHLTLLKAFEIVAKDYPELDWRLTLVGNRYDGAKEIYKAVEKASEADQRIQWLGIVDDATLHRLYEESTFTIYSSLVEGFGMPILESIWHSRVCLCHSQGVMAELAQLGGCMVVDMSDANAIAKAIHLLSSDRKLLAELQEVACRRQLKTWDDYTVEVMNILGLKNIPVNLFNHNDSTMNWNTISWENLLYPNCLLNRWQMHDSERMALNGLLARHQPKCSVEIGTYYGGSLSLISQYSGVVFSIDIDPEVPMRVPAMENVSFLIGKSQDVVPLLFQALDEADIPIDFILIDGDHSADGVLRDINIILSYVPKQPLFVMMHDSFNPECRRGIMTAKWQDCPYVAWVEVDFVPGRIIEGDDNAAKGEMWGGLALALLLPTPRQGHLTINASTTGFYDLALKSRN
ncbi:hypothetical protein RIVM261_082460 [Rivularia sp. IAM M-261]|nr:hypothetical protein RIVM261_082460 [Rivularia sp. IAM M-261]